MRNKDNVTNTNDNSSDVSAGSVAVGRGTIIAGGEINDDISVITESATVNLLTQQTEYYESDDKEELKMDTLKTIQTYVKKIFRQAKFLSDTGSNFNKPNFVIQNDVKSQSVEICEYLWKSLGKFS